MVLSRNAERRAHRGLQSPDGASALLDEDVDITVREAPDARHVRGDRHGDGNPAPTAALLGELEEGVRDPGSMDVVDVPLDKGMQGIGIRHRTSLLLCCSSIKYNRQLPLGWIQERIVV